MNRQQATEFVIRELGKHHQRNDIIQRLCETGGINWAAAEKFVQQVEAENSSKIALRQSPLITLIGIGTVIGGLGLMVWIVMATLSGIIIYFLSFPIPYLGNITYFFTGLAMLAGGIWGMWDTIRKIWDS
ncbi:MAG TPA: hypothetical protein VLE49_11500 [Anaerolineales bacterium]|nr:hypothetical protein [Anaerolineales bacterium]